ncbi:MAG: sporulation/spore germination protein [Leptolyngbyaceae cyanobacterium SL_5_9]|nr:sporulation/spore germination protein [Leptolyngbyaceae cyanobacterium SL_5_9]
MKSILPLSVFVSGMILLGLGSCSYQQAGDRPLPNSSAPPQANSESSDPAIPASPAAVSEVSTSQPDIQPSDQTNTQPDTQSGRDAAANPEAAIPEAAIPETVETVTATLYTADNECETFVSEEIQVPADQPITAAVSKVLQSQNNSDFDLSGFRVSVEKGVATVDLRLVSGSRRRITSLSTCEQFALFGGLRETLTRNTQWQIKSVRFLERGVAIAR